MMYLSSQGSSDNKLGMIGRLLIWFKDGEESLHEYSKQFGPLAMLLNRLLNETYEGKKIKFLNLYFYTQKSFEVYKQTELNYTHSYGGHVHYNALFNRREFDVLALSEQKKLLWKISCEILQIIARDTRNSTLEISAATAYNKGIEMGLNEDFVMRSANFQIHDHSVKVSILARFVGERVLSVLSVQSDNKLILEEEIDSTDSDNEFFYTIYKKIELDKNNNIVIKGHYSINYLPMTVPFADKLKQSR
ncbi:hypothetical protein [Pontibacter flavimaris]|uniref:Uncharacterized protein n=1 Tax=Pontibacter flavimaris TaxID=1797110 RepID=A0A1Q5P9T1_9BACT|nr:hypothetical protein [Pontibacter flavimaris]OKL38996.1 hypothetical protein A3841_03340 [Pontibacter flavimaris]